MDKDQRHFYECMSISIRRFLDENFDFYNEKQSQTRAKRWKLKHSEIAFLPNLVEVPARFCNRYKNLIYSGKVLVVKDEFGKYKTYLNPSLVKNISNEEDLAIYVEALSSDEELYHAELQVFARELQEILETKRIATCFHGEKQIEIVKNLERVYRRKEND